MQFCAWLAGLPGRGFGEVLFSSIYLFFIRYSMFFSCPPAFKATCKGSKQMSLSLFCPFSFAP